MNRLILIFSFLFLTGFQSNAGGIKKINWKAVHKRRVQKEDAYKLWQANKPKEVDRKPSSSDDKKTDESEGKAGGSEGKIGEG
jgi:hypothetical protein